MPQAAYVPSAVIGKTHPRFDGLEEELINSQWLGGDKLAAKDRETYEELQEHMPPNADLYPSLFFWWSMVSRFAPDTRASWK